MSLQRRVRHPTGHTTSVVMFDTCCYFTPPKLRNIVRYSTPNDGVDPRSSLIPASFASQFADSWSATIAQSAARSDNSSPVGIDTTDVSQTTSHAMRTMRGVVGSLTSFILSPSREANRGKLQVTS